MVLSDLLANLNLIEDWLRSDLSFLEFIVILVSFSVWTMLLVPSQILDKPITLLLYLERGPV